MVDRMTKKDQDILIGGMALLEGVMMKSPEKIGIAVRAPDGGMKTTSYGFTSITKRSRFLALPI
jgi:uncharacterized protein YqhQ